MSKDGQTGVCQYCGQSMLITTVGGNLTQGELDAKATDLCKCLQGASERRKKERKEKIEAYVDQNFPTEIKNWIRDGVEMVDKKDIPEFSGKLDDDRAFRAWLDADDHLQVKVKKTSVTELKV